MDGWVISVLLTWCACAVVSCAIIKKQINLVQRMNYEAIEHHTEPLLQSIRELREREAKGARRLKQTEAALAQAQKYASAEVEFLEEAFAAERKRTARPSCAKKPRKFDR